MIRQGGYRFSGKIMLRQRARLWDEVGALGSPRSNCYNAPREDGRRGHRMGGKSVIDIARVAALALLIGSGTLVPAASAQSFTDKLKNLFGGSSKSEDQQPPIVSGEPEPDMDCPRVAIRAGASTYAVAAPGKQAVGDDVRYQATITKMARECSKANGEITAHIGVQGRIIVGPAGAPASIEVPLRVAVVQSGV